MQGASKLKVEEQSEREMSPSVCSIFFHCPMTGWGRDRICKCYVTAKRKAFKVQIYGIGYCFLKTKTHGVSNKSFTVINVLSKNSKAEKVKVILTGLKNLY